MITLVFCAFVFESDLEVLATLVISPVVMYLCREQLTKQLEDIKVESLPEIDIFNSKNSLIREVIENSECSILWYPAGNVSIISNSLKTLLKDT
jgi:hypothetical protein